MDLSADCGRCAGLCCVALAFDRGPLFGYDKPAGEACRHLSPTHRCTIHANRAARGFAGCAAYDCLGAGQAATALFSGTLPSESTYRARLTAFRILREVHTLAAALTRLADDNETRRCRELLDPPTGWTYAGLLLLERSPILSEVRGFLATRLAANTALPIDVTRFEGRKTS